MSFSWKKFIVCTCVLLGGMYAPAQVFHAQAGTSSLLDAHGGSIGFEAPGYNGAFGIGVVNDRVELGGVVRMPLASYVLTAGDETLRFNLPTDVFDTSYFLVGRGIGISRTSEQLSFTSFAGSTSEYIGASYFQAAKSGRAFFANFADLKLTKNWTFNSRMVLSKKQTLINGLSFAPSKFTRFAINAGMGTNAPYFATAFKMERRKYDLKLSFIGADSSFRRSSARFPVTSEPDRDNELFTYRFSDNGSITFARQNILSPLGSDTPLSQRASVHQVTGNYSMFKVQMGAGFYQSRVSGGDNIGVSFRATRPITRRIDAGFDFNRNSFNSQVNSSASASLREALTRHISTIQYVSHSGDQTTFSFGGEVHFKRIDLAVTNDTAYVPFRSQASGGPFIRVYNVSISLRPFRSLLLQAQSNVDATGRVRYTASAGDYYYRYAGLQDAGPREAAGGEFFKYVVTGSVVDLEGNPIAGAALQIGPDLVFTNEQGEFTYRVKKKLPMAFKVSFRDFLTNDYYEIVNAPITVTSEEEDKAVPLKVVLRKISRQLGLKMLAAAEQAEPSTTSSSKAFALPQE